jgi:hypothetical protein
MGYYGLDSTGSECRIVEGYFEHGNEHSGSIKFWKILEYQSDWRIPRKDSAS